MTEPKPTITMYRTASCPFCVAAESLLASKEIDFEQVYLDDHPDRRGFVSRLLPGHFTVPLVVVDERPIGGFDELRSLESRGELDAILGAG